MKINDPVYGEFEIDEPVILEVLESAPVQRIKHINQAGTSLVQDFKIVTRYDHCVGAMLLLRKYGANVEEQIAGLLHDVPHTAFSHAADFVFHEETTGTYHERFLHKIVFESSIPKILEKHGLDPERVTEEANFSLLEQQLPALCADRIDYSLRDMLVDCTGAISKDEINTILEALTTHEGRFVMTDQTTALMYARKFYKQCLENWNSPTTLVTFEILANLIRSAFDEKVLTEGDLFGTDETVISKVRAARNPKLEKWLNLLSPNLEIKLDDNDFDFDTRGKVRYIDPPILTGGTVKPLSLLNKEFAAELEDFFVKAKRGHRIKIIS